MEKTEQINKLSEIDQEYPAYLVKSPNSEIPICAVLCNKGANGGLVFEHNFIKAIEEEYGSDIDTIVYVAEHKPNLTDFHTYKVKATIDGFTEEFLLYPLYVY